MDQLQDYREAARLRYQRKQDEEREREKEKIKEREKQQEEENRKERDHSAIYEMLADWDHVVENMNQDMILSLHLLYTILTEEKMELIRNYDRLDEVQERVIRLVNRLNDLNEKENKNLDEVREMSAMMQQLIAQSGVDITIQEMNTDGDADFCRQLQEEEMKEMNFPAFPVASFSVQPVEEKEEKSSSSSSSSSSSKAFVSLSTTKGMRLQTLRALARSHEIVFDEKENRRELAIRLASHGLVRIEE